MERTVRLIQRLGVELVDDVWHIRVGRSIKIHMSLTGRDMRRGIMTLF